ncbi:hypothetical protein ON010_g1438 [Phytophthora cinnamomi]|nr:hypothetical protein ON010_g1438 [Phytophthora cinnamomi]
MEPGAPAPTATAAPVDPPTTATDPQTTGADAATQKKKRAKKRFVFPKGINMKKYFARKPGKARRQYVEGFRQREKAKLKPPKEKVVQTIVSRPWVTPEMDEAAQVLAAEKEKKDAKAKKAKATAKKSLGSSAGPRDKANRKGRASAKIDEGGEGGKKGGTPSKTNAATKSLASALWLADYSSSSDDE